MICLKFFLDLVTLMASEKKEFFSYNNEKLDILASISLKKNFRFRYVNREIYFIVIACAKINPICKC